MTLSFVAPLWQWEGEGGWHFVTLPAEVADEVRDHAPPRRGFGSVRVTVVVGESTWQTSLFPETKTGSYVLPVKEPVRRANDLVVGDQVQVSIRLE